MADQVVDEEWRPAPGFSGYEVSNLGRIKSLARVIIRSNGSPQRINERILRPGRSRIKTQIYLHVVLTGKSDVMIHALVCEAFHGPKPSQKHEVAHWDGDGANCRADNLRWATHGENHEDKLRHGRDMRGEKHHNAKLTKDDIREIRKRLAAGETQLSIAKSYDVCRQTIGDVATRQNWNWLE